MNIYYTYRPTYTNRSNRYDVSYYNDKVFADFVQAWLTKMIDWANFIPDNRITLETAPWIKTLRRCGVLKCADIFTPEQVEVLKSDLVTTTQNFLLRILTKEEMLVWVRNNTDLEEIEEWKFLIQKADGDLIKEDIYLIID